MKSEISVNKFLIRTKASNISVKYLFKQTNNKCLASSLVNIDKISNFLYHYEHICNRFGKVDQINWLAVPDSAQGKVV